MPLLRIRRARKQASASTDALRQAYSAMANADVDPDDYDNHAWVRDVRVDPDELIVDHKGALYRVPWSGSDGDFTFGERTEVAVRYVDVAKALLAKAEHTGAMVALMLPADTAKTLAVDGGEKPEDLHVTLAYLGDAADLEDTERLADVVRGWAAATGPLTGEVSGIGRFTSGEDAVTYASVDLPDLPAARQRLVDLLTDAGFAPDATHGFSPHVTLAYAAADVDGEQVTLDFREATLAIAGNQQAFPLGATPTAKADIEVMADLWKAETADQRIVYGVVMQPGLPDSQGDTVSAEEIEKAAHRWLVESRKSDVQHNGTEAKVSVVESYVLKQDALVEGRRVHGGSWIVAVKVDDDELWDRVTKHELTGFSIGGSAIRTPDPQPTGAD